MMRIRVNSRKKLLLSLVAILTFSFMGVSLLNYYMTRASIRTDILRTDLPLTMDNIYSELTAELMRPLLIASSMASDAFLEEWTEDGEVNTERIRRYLSKIKEKYGFFTAFFVSTESSNYYHYNGVHKRVSPSNAHDAWFYDFLASDKEYAFDVDTDEADSNILTIFINYKVFGYSGKVLGVAGVGVKVDHVASLVAEYEERYGRAVYLTDTQGVLQVHPDMAMIEKINVRDMEGIGLIAGEIFKKNSESANFSFNREDTRILLTVRYIEDLDWYLYVEQNETRALANARTNFLRTILIGFVSSCAIIVLTLLTINRYQAKLEVLVIVDQLTGVANRRKLEEEFVKILYTYSRSRQPFSLILMDLDGFKKVNDLKGHLAGDVVLKKIAELIAQVVRPTDLLARWGGDEFVVLASGTVEEAVLMAERIRKIINTSDLAGSGKTKDDPRNRITVSCGVCAYSEGDGLDEMLLKADQALYICKARDGNCVEWILPDTQKNRKKGIQ